MLQKLGLQVNILRDNLWVIVISHKSARHCECKDNSLKADTTFYWAVLVINKAGMKLMFTWNVARMTDRLTDRSLTASFNLTNFPSRNTAVRLEVGGLTLPGSPLSCVWKKV